MFILSNITALIIAAIIALVFYLRRRFTYWSRNGVPGPNCIEWRAFTSIYHDFTVEQIKKYGRIYGSYDFLRRTLIVNEPDLIRDIMVKDFSIFPDHLKFHKGSTKAKLGLFFLDGNDHWKKVRSLVSPTYTSGKLKLMTPNISNIADKFVHTLEKFEGKDASIDLTKYIGAYTMDVISVCAYGIDIDTINEPNHPIVVNANKIMHKNASLSFVLSFLFPPIANYLKLEPIDIFAAKYFDDLTHKLIEERKKLYENLIDKNKKRVDFLQLMIDNEKNDEDLDIDCKTEEISFEEDINSIHKTSINLQKSNRILSTDEITAQSMLLFVVGYNTTSAAISHTIYYLCQNKECQQRLYEELQTINDFSYETLKNLKHLNGVINETLRLAPSFTRMSRECVEDYKLGNTGITIPAGTSVQILPYALHRDPEFFPEPELFKPERFIKDSGEPQPHPFAYIPFGGGLRSCVGDRFVLNKMRMCIAKLISKFEFNLAPDFKIEYYNGNFLMAPKKLMVSIKVRK